MLSHDLEKCRTQLAVATAELGKSKEAPPGNVLLRSKKYQSCTSNVNTVVFPVAGSLDQMKEELKVAQAGKHQAKKQLATGERVLTRTRDDKNKLRDSNTLLGEELKDMRAQLVDAVKENRKLWGSLFSMLLNLPSCSLLKK